MSTQTQPSPQNLPTADAVSAIANLAVKAAGVKFDELSTDRPVLVWPDKTIQDVEHLNARPVAKRGKAVLLDAVAFAAYVNAHRTTGLVIFGEITETGGSFTAILDGHVAVQLAPREGTGARAEILDGGEAGWGEHRVLLPLVATPEWARWITLAGKSLPQEAFAVFLEENAADVIVPPVEVKAIAGYPVPHGQLPNAGELMSVALTLQAKTDVTFDSKINRHNGQVQVSYRETLNATAGAEGNLTVPEFFTLAIAPFRGASPQFVLCRLRFRCERGAAKFEFQIIRPHKIVEHAWKLVAADIVAATGADVLLGSVELPVRKG